MCLSNMGWEAAATVNTPYVSINGQPMLAIF